MADFLTPELLIAWITLTFLEIILGIDNIIFISIVSNKLEPAKQPRARRLGLTLALVFRLLLLLAITWIIRLTDPLLTIPAVLFIEEAVPISIRDLILILGGIFLLAKSTTEIHHKISGEQDGGSTRSKPATMASVLAQIILLDMVFSFDSILTAIGLIEIDPNDAHIFQPGIVAMMAAVIVAIIVMLVAAEPISRFINKQPTLQILALSFLILIGVMLIVEGFHVHVPKGYIYFSVAFSLVVELLNMRLRKRRVPPPENG